MSGAKPSVRAKKGKSKPIARGNGKTRRTPQQLERQERVWKLSVLEFKTIRAIAAEVKIAQETVISDLRYEFARVEAETERRRANEQAISIATYQGIAVDAIRKGEMYDGIAGAGGKVVDHTLDARLKARERLDKILGIESPTRVDLTMQTLIDALEPK